jgi:hypothetical protein
MPDSAAPTLRRAMVALIERGEPHEAHPAYWAPFAPVGEGSADVLAPTPLATSSVNSGPVPPKKALHLLPSQCGQASEWRAGLAHRNLAAVDSKITRLTDQVAGIATPASAFDPKGFYEDLDRGSGGAAN